MPKTRKPAIEDLQRQVDELTNALQRERADSVNLRRRVEEERAQLGNFYKSMVVRDYYRRLTTWNAR
jgi:molecular chaperone GrpE (heat shock protein)